MAYSEKLAEQLEKILADESHITQKKMFGGLCFLYKGNMLCGVVGEQLMARVGPSQYEQCLAKPYARAMDFTSRPMKGMIFIGQGGLKDSHSIQKWVECCLKFVRFLPSK